MPVTYTKRTPLIKWDVVLRLAGGKWLNKLEPWWSKLWGFICFWCLVTDVSHVWKSEYKLLWHSITSNMWWLHLACFLAPLGVILWHFSGIFHRCLRVAIPTCWLKSGLKCVDDVTWKDGLLELETFRVGWCLVKFGYWLL